MIPKRMPSLADKIRARAEAEPAIPQKVEEATPVKAEKKKVEKTKIKLKAKTKKIK